MEEILSSIKRIIAEEGDATPARGNRRQARPQATPLQPPLVGDELEDEVLELSDPIPASRPDPARPARAEASAPAPRPEPVSEEKHVAEPTPSSPTLISDGAAAASRGALDQLSRLLIKPEPGSDGSLEGLVRELLRPMLSDWLDAKLPTLVEAMVAREIKRITGQTG